MLQQAQLPSPALQSSADLVSSAAQANNPAAAKDPLMEKAKEFEAVFLNEMLQNMFTGLDEGGTYGNSEAPTPGAPCWSTSTPTHCLSPAALVLHLQSTRNSSNFKRTQYDQPARR